MKTIKSMTPEEIQSNWKFVSGFGDDIYWVRGLHPSFSKSRHIPQTGTYEHYVPKRDKPKAAYYGKYGYPVDLELVWADRERYQDEL